MVLRLGYQRQHVRTACFSLFYFFTGVFLFEKAYVFHEGFSHVDAKFFHYFFLFGRNVAFIPKLGAGDDRLLVVTLELTGE